MVIRHPLPCSNRTCRFATSGIEPPELMAVYPKAGLWVPQKSVMHVVRVNPLSGDNPKHVGGCRDSALASGRSRPRNVEGGDDAQRTPHEAVIHVVGVDILSGNEPQQVDAFRYGALVRACTRARNVECGD